MRFAISPTERLDVESRWPETSISVNENKVFVVDIDDDVSSSRFSVDQPTWFVLAASFNPGRKLTRPAIIPCQKHWIFA
jgi:hypothetical protein